MSDMYHSYRVLVCGGRDFSDRNHLFQVLDDIHHDHPITLIIPGAARGADSLAGEWARSRDVALDVYPADWDRFGRSAGFRRNAQMLAEGTPDLVIPFPGGRGTNMMTDLAMRQAVPVHLPIRDLPVTCEDYQQFLAEIESASGKWDPYGMV